MNTNSLTLHRVVRACSLLLAACLHSVVFAQSSGLITGQVSNAATGAFLEGAEVSVLPAVSGG